MELQTPTFDLHWPELTQAGIPILGLTSMATRNSLPPALAARVTQAISKPIHIHDLFDAIKPIEGKSPRPEAPATWLSTPSSFSSRSGQDGPESPARTHRKAPQRTLRRRMASEVAHASPPGRAGRRRHAPGGGKSMTRRMRRWQKPAPGGGQA